MDQKPPKNEELSDLYQLCQPNDPMKKDKKSQVQLADQFHQLYYTNLIFTNDTTNKIIIIIKNTTNKIVNGELTNPTG